MYVLYACMYERSVCVCVCLCVWCGCVCMRLSLSFVCVCVCVWVRVCVCVCVCVCCLIDWLAGGISTYFPSLCVESMFDLHIKPDLVFIEYTVNEVAQRFTFDDDDYLTSLYRNHPLINLQRLIHRIS